MLQIRSQTSSLVLRDNTSPPLSPASSTTSSNNLPPFLDPQSSHDLDTHPRAVSPHSQNLFPIKKEPTLSPTRTKGASPAPTNMYPTSFIYSNSSSRSSPMFSLPYPTTSNNNSNASPFLHNPQTPFPEFNSLKSTQSQPPVASIPSSGTSPSQLGLLALAAIADEQDATENRQANFANNNPANTTSNNNNAPFSTFFPTPNSTYNSTTGMLSPSQTVRLHKRKSSCSEYEEETKKPRAMNLSHILCS